MLLCFIIGCNLLNEIQPKTKLFVVVREGGGKRDGMRMGEIVISRTGVPATSFLCVPLTCDWMVVLFAG
jgi:hypothetical protein